MAKKFQSGDVNKSDHVRDLLRQNPHITVTEAIATLAKNGIDLKPSLFYFVKGKIKGRKGRRKKARQMVEKVTATMGSDGVVPTKTADVVATIVKVKHLAAEVGGLKKLKALVEALSE
jgi:hypothetical protein